MTDPPQTYGTPRYCIAIPTTPPYCEGGATAIPSGETAEAPTTSFAFAWATAACWAASCERRRASAWIRELRLAAGLLGLELGDLALDRAEQLLALRQAGLDLLLRGGALGDDLLLPDVGRAQLDGTRGDDVLEPLDLGEHLRVLRGDAVHRLDSVQEVVQARAPSRIASVESSWSDV